MFVIKYRKIFYAITATITGAALYAVFVFGLNLGIDFKGGSIAEAKYSAAPNLQTIREKVQALNIGEFSLRQTGESGVIVRTKDLSDAQRESFLAALRESGEGATVVRFDAVGPVLGRELAGKAIWSIALVIIAIVLFITFAFRKVSKPVASWKYGVVAIVALVHDVLVPTGAFAYMGRFGGLEIDALFVTALLVVLGFSVHDTIVVFDRTRENLRKNEGATQKDKKDFETIVGRSVSQTFTRSINTSLTTLLALTALYFFGPVATKNFSLALLIGITAGTYSSIFLASPLMVTLEKLQNRKSKV